MQLSTFGSRHKYARTVLNNFSGAQVAEAAGITRASVTNWEKLDEATANAVALNKACQFMGVNLEWMISGTGPIKPNENQPTLPVFSWDDIDQKESGETIAPLDQITTSAYMPKGPRSYAVRIPFDSLIEFAAGDTIIVDPDRNPRNGQYLLYKLDGKQAIVNYIELPGNRKHVSPLTPNAELQQYQSDALIAVINGKWYP